MKRDKKPIVKFRILDGAEWSEMIELYSPAQIKFEVYDANDDKYRLDVVETFMLSLASFTSKTYQGSHIPFRRLDNWNIIEKLQGLVPQLWESIRRNRQNGRT